MQNVSAHLQDRFVQYTRLVRADKPIGALLLMWPMLWALWFVSSGQPDPLVLAVFVVGTFLMRSAGCAINDFADRRIDGSVKRTSQRPIVTGAVTPREALLVAAALALLSFVLVLSMNWLTVLLSFVGLALAAAYPFTKRITYWPQLVLGLAFGWAVPMVCAAQTGAIGWIGWLIYVAAIIWAFAYDTIYAMVDRDDDIVLGVKSTAIRLGQYDVAAVALAHATVLLIVFAVGWSMRPGWFFIIGMAAATLVALWQIKLISNRDRDRCFRAFLANNYMGAAAFAGIAVQYIVSPG